MFFFAIFVLVLTKWCMVDLQILEHFCVFTFYVLACFMRECGQGFQVLIIIIIMGQLFLLSLTSL